MKNLNLKELTIEEQKNTNGGGLIGLLALTMLADAILDAGNSWEAIKSGYNSQEKVNGKVRNW